VEAGIAAVGTRETERRRDGETERRRDGETETFSFSVRRRSGPAAAEIMCQFVREARLPRTGLREASYNEVSREWHEDKDDLRRENLRFNKRYSVREASKTAVILSAMAGV
jgi:hypothetical protein